MGLEKLYPAVAEQIAHYPPDIKPRLLDHISRTFPAASVKSLMHRATHISLGIAASQQFALWVGDNYRKLREEMTPFAPHPFESYSLNFWMGNRDDAMVELLVLVEVADGETRASNVFRATWGEEIDETGIKMSHRYYEPVAEDERSLTEYQHMASAFDLLDSFRLMLTRPGAITINSGKAPSRTGIHKGRRVTYYTQSAVTIDLERAAQPLIVNHTGHGSPRAAYGYRAHLCHSGGSATCVHEWVEIGGRMVADKWVPNVENGRANATWQCHHCDRKRWHRRAGERGSLKVGEVRQTYQIKKGRDDIVPS